MFVLSIHPNIPSCQLLKADTATEVEGCAKRQFSDGLVSVQLWIVSRVGNDPVYSIRKSVGRTYVGVFGGNITVANGTPVIGYRSGTGNPDQHWIFTSTTDKGVSVLRNLASGSLS
ncbi:hypothetical protein BDY19DRAFT_716886 [Irpex rosettiformis]|uniref:Uncharacterized protein n=1 Tax=Irpex rosettiformis TaxID=378272 RepID=A0ACB8U895_9APHY|nr:hypothetical protein BDY19DRAFT_716886 [Irpex rosettiformis]